MARCRVGLGVPLLILGRLTSKRLPRFQSPWGKVDLWEQLGDDIWVVHTPSHGGLYVGPESLALLPDEVKWCMRDRPWFEEDSELGIVLALLWDRCDQGIVERCFLGLTREQVLDRAESDARFFDGYAACLEAILQARPR